jgi:hypothetical protein
VWPSIGAAMYSVPDVLMKMISEVCTMSPVREAASTATL